ncbi:hypothetical protein [Posidoniimonas polymericola]|uniref:hypothetical protein n=1 Tax=Posidoniimonas polymericola TaxID=2528002 RepID=UPI0011B63ECB|nr:hypothetical protein [Posidoniimonas polymericola]
MPTGTDEARVNWGGSTVTLDFEAETFNRLLIGVDEAGVVEVQDGGVLTTTQDVVVGNNGFTDGTMIVSSGGVVNVGRISWVARGPVVGDVLGFLTIESGGVFNVASHLWWGSTGIAEVSISGTLNQTGGILGLGSADFNTVGGTATVNVLSGGEMNLNNIFTTDGETKSIQPGSKIDIHGTGRVTLPGDFVDALGSYRDAGLLHGNGTPGAVTIETEAGALPDGDFNGDGLVDAADYTVYRDNIGSVAGLPNDGGLGVVGDLHYDLWEANYGAVASVLTVVTAGLPSASISAAPEPTSLILIGMLGVLAGPTLRRR